jgi:hypothetical protein
MMRQLTFKRKRQKKTDDLEKLSASEYDNVSKPKGDKELTGYQC